MGRALLAVFAAFALLAGCGGGSRGEAGSTVACDDAAFRAQDEELYVTKTAVSNAAAASGEPAVLLPDLQRARRALAGYFDAHPPCTQALEEVESAERAAIGSLDDAIEALEQGEGAGSPLRAALAGLTDARSRLGAAG